MKRIIANMVVLGLMVVNSNGQNGSVDSSTVSFGLEINHFSSASGFKSGIEPSLSVKEFKRTLEFSLYFDSESNKFTGFSVHHKYFMFRNTLKQKSFSEPYLFVNFLYRATTLDEPLCVNQEIARYFGLSGKTVYKSMEYHLGIGVKKSIKIGISRSLYINGNIGFGRYVGSIKRPSRPDPLTGLYVGGNGWGLITKLGVGFDI